MSDENTQVVLTVRLPISCSFLTVLVNAVTTEHGEVYMHQIGDFLQFYKVLKGGAE